MQLDHDLPKNKKHVRITALAVAGFVFALCVMDVWLSQKLDSNTNDAQDVYILVAKAVIENIAAGTAAAFILAFGYRSIVQIIDPADRVLEVAPDEITKRLQDNARRTKKYSFIGNTATFVCASILPILCARARTTGHTITTKLFIIDPRNEGLINAYLQHKSLVGVARSNIASSALASWTRPIGEASGETSIDAKAKLYACIYLCAYASKSSGIAIDLYLRQSFTPFRADVSDKEAILTQESASESAVAFSSRGHFYGWYDKEAEALQQQCTEIELSNNPKLRNVTIVHPSGARVQVGASLRDLISALPELNFNLETEVFEATVKRIISPSHSYAS